MTSAELPVFLSGVAVGANAAILGIWLGWMAERWDKRRLAKTAPVEKAKEAHRG